MVRLLLIIILILSFTFLVFGQNEHAKAELPSDLQIQLSVVSRGRQDPGYSYSITINRDGTWYYEGFRGVFIGRFTGPELGRANEERLSKLGKSGSKMTVDRLNETDLLYLVLEFKAIDFLNLNEKYSWGQTDPTNNNEPILCTPHNATETIYFIFDGRTKAVQNFTGCFAPVNKKLTALGEKIRNKLNFR